MDIPWPPGMYHNGVKLLDIPNDALRIIGREAVATEGNQIKYKIWFDY